MTQNYEHYLKSQFENVFKDLFAKRNKILSELETIYKMLAEGKDITEYDKL